MIFPRPRLIWITVAAFPVALLPALLHPRLWGIWLVCLALTVLAFGLDVLLSVPPRMMSVAVECPQRVAVGELGVAKVTLRAPRAAGQVELLLDLHPDFVRQPIRAVRLQPARPETLGIALQALRRGALTVDEAWVGWTGPLRLAGRRKRVPIHRTVAVIPSLKAVRAAAFRYFGAQHFQSGVQVERFVGAGSEFEALREYVPGHDIRAINWKASARHRKLLTQQFRAERNHQVVLAVDTGHLMVEPLDGLARLDHAISSALLLAYVSLRLGDRVGMFGFDAGARAWIEPHGGLAAFSRLEALSAQLAYSNEETNFTLGLAELSTRLRRRSLVVVFTEFVDTVTAELMVENLSRLAQRQLVVFVSLRDPSLDALALGWPKRLSDVQRAVVASEFVREREGVLAQLRRIGIHCIDAAPSAVSVQLVNRYLEVKRREQIA